MQRSIVEGGILLHRCKTSVCVQVQPVRWRKPWWLPQAPSKVFRLPKVIVKPKEEEVEERRVDNNYNAYKRSLWAFMKTRFEAKESLAKTHEQEITEDAEIDKIIEMIDRDNAKVRANREAALVVEWKNMEREILQTKARLEEEQAQKLLETEKLVHAELERLKTAIPVEGVDEAIEKALASEADYNFSIDKKGNKYYGRFTRPDPRLLEEPRRQLQSGRTS